MEISGVLAYQVNIWMELLRQAMRVHNKYLSTLKDTFIFINMVMPEQFTVRALNVGT